MTRAEVIARLVAQGVQIGEHDVFPKELPSKPFSPGLHLFPGGTGRGKTLSALALRIHLGLQGFACVFKNVMEPRGMNVAITPSKSGDVQASEVAGLTGTGGDSTLLYGTLLENWMLKVNQMAQKRHVGCLFIDSGTYLLKALPETQSALAVDKGPTFKEGLAYGDLLGVLHHQMRAEEKGVALIMTINSELLPVVGSLAGAAEGSISMLGIGELAPRSRATARSEISLKLDPRAIVMAREILGYGDQDRGFFTGSSIVG
jgi:hypothetical protein